MKSIIRNMLTQFELASGTSLILGQLLDLQSSTTEHIQQWNIWNYTFSSGMQKCRKVLVSLSTRTYIPGQKLQVTLNFGATSSKTMTSSALSLQQITSNTWYSLWRMACACMCPCLFEVPDDCLKAVFVASLEEQLLPICDPPKHDELRGWNKSVSWPEKFLGVTQVNWN